MWMCLNVKKIDQIINDDDQAVTLSQPLLEQLINRYPAFTVIGEKIGNLLQQPMI